MSQHPSLAASLALLLAASLSSGCDNKPSSGPSAQPSTTAAMPSSAPSPSSAPAASASTAPVDKDPLAAIALGTIFRDDEDLVLDGTKENWRLEWSKAPVPHCMAGGTFTTCPCEGFAFGEKGDMDLVRTIPGKPDERLRLDTFFAEGDTIMQRWPVLKADKDKALATDGGAALDMVGISMRPLVSIIKFADYDHDGRASEFLLQIGATPCGHTQTIVVGVSKSNPKLHAFGTKETPNEPLVLDSRAAWESILKKPQADVTTIACGDHGATEQTIVHVTADGDLHAKTETKKCP